MDDMASCTLIRMILQDYDSIMVPLDPLDMVCEQLSSVAVRD